ncbi:MAG: transcription elongation factor GreA [Crenarchaeota archaeon]|nr:transcription elongation factor GreA [Thermoproteota archaeon]
MNRFKITKEGFQKMKEDLNNLITVERPAISNAIGEAIELGDLSENEEYSSAKDKQKVIEAMIASLSDRLAHADIVDLSSCNGDCIAFGAVVELLDLNTEKKIKYQLLSEFEANLEKGTLSIESLVGRSLVGKKQGDEIEIITPGGVKEYEILKVEYNS